MEIKSFLDQIGVEFFVGVPDSQLKALCDYLMNTYGIDPHKHLIAANEGNCTALAAGYYLATGKIPLVYMQNSGEGNIINPVASLMNDKVYAIPCIFVVGWRGEPGVHDEPQHIYQGEVTLKLLEDMEIKTLVVGPDTTVNQVAAQMEEWKPWLASGHQVAFVVRKGALQYDQKVRYVNNFSMTREQAIKDIIAVTGEDVIVSTTGKASRELFEAREALGQGHQCDFLTVGSMGHSSSIALGIALQKPTEKIWCLDGDGAALMHMGSMAVIGANHPTNLVHILINNQAHETVGGMPTVSGTMDWQMLAKACGYQKTAFADNEEQLHAILQEAKTENCLTFLEVRCANGARADLGRPTTTPQQNKQHFMERLANGG